MERTLHNILGTKHYDADTLSNWLLVHNPHVQIFGNVVPGRGQIWILKMKNAQNLWQRDTLISESLLEVLAQAVIITDKEINDAEV